LHSDGSAGAEVFFDGDHEGGPGVTHGGWTAGMFDEVLGLALNRRLGKPAVTRDLNVRYLRPVPIGRLLLVEAWGTPLDGDGRWRMRGRLRLASNGAELSSASGVWVERSESHYVRHQRWLRDQDRSER
jgi:acyl-coenzyme A thioesterase PaaI-like protein